MSVRKDVQDLRRGGVPSSQLPDLVPRVEIWALSKRLAFGVTLPRVPVAGDFIELMGTQYKVVSVLFVLGDQRLGDVTRVYVGSY